ncbi:MAG: nucleotidyltransferase domain-containing protein [Acidobacteria bacterium]|nr:nucleotidyltransferase domain-containing protein [Acidobacteriota bacterium]
MPVKSSNSSVLAWPDARAVALAFRSWAENLLATHPEVLRAGYIGSCADGRWGVGSDLDVLLVVEDSDVPFERRAAQWDALTLPVPVDLRVYTRKEWDRLPPDGRFLATVRKTAVWVERPSGPSDPSGERGK